MELGNWAEVEIVEIDSTEVNCDGGASGSPRAAREWEKNSTTTGDDDPTSNQINPKLTCPGGNPDFDLSGVPRDTHE